jgi:hypothetical protein
MTESDPVFVRLSELRPSEPDPALSNALRARAHAVLVPRRVHPVWTLGIAASVVTYLGWAVYFTSSLY